MSDFALFAVPVGGGTLALSPLPGRGGEFENDLNDIQEWKPSLVLSLTTAAELAEVGAELLGIELQTRAARWLHMPIPDFGVPDKDFMDDWPKVSDKILLALRGGGRVLLHCKGGCGRSGMVALRLMVEAGQAVDEALGQLRAVRPCAIETDAQFEWAASGHRRVLPRPGGVHCV